MKVRITVTLVVFLVLATINAFAQQAVTSGAISVRVFDATGAAVPGVSVTVLNTDLNQTWKATGDEQGRQRFPLLPLGPYDLRIEKDGFAAYTAKLVLSLGQSLELPVTLNVANLNEQVVVSVDPT